MAFLRKEWLIKYLWIAIVVQVFLGVAIALYPHVLAKSSSAQNTLQNKQNQIATDNSPFYTFASLVILLAFVQATEKAINLNKNQRNITGESFLIDYTDALTDAFSIAPGISIMTEEQISDAQGSLLKFISKFVAAYYVDKTGLEISANLMVRKEITDYREDEFRQKVYFCDPARLPSSYECVLVMVKTSSPLVNVPQDFALPVDKDEDRLFFGAPKAFVTGSDSIINNVKNDSGNGNAIDLILKGQPNVVAKGIRDHFQKMEYESFASIPLRTSKGKIIGVINIQSNRPYIFGKNNQDADEIKKYLTPFFSVLTALIK